MATADDGEAFWRFSLAFYARPDVATALIGLQDSAGCDVNMILYALWVGAVRGEAIDGADIAAAAAAGAALRDAVVAELRGLRRRLRGDGDADVQAVRRHIQAVEIAAERRVQRRMTQAAGRRRAAAGDRVAIAAANLAAYLGPASDSVEAETVRLALARFMRRV